MNMSKLPNKQESEEITPYSNPVSHGISPEKPLPAPPAASVVSATPSTKLEIIFAWASQIFAIAIAVLFGVYSILSYYAAELAIAEAKDANVFSAEANMLSNRAMNASMLSNQLTLLSLCQALLQQGSGSDGSTAAGGPGFDGSTTSLVCSQLLQLADFPQLVLYAFPGLVLPTQRGVPTPTASNRPSSGTPSPNASPGGAASLTPPEIAAVVGSIMGALALGVAVLSFLIFRQRLARQRHRNDDSSRRFTKYQFES